MIRTLQSKHRWRFKIMKVIGIVAVAKNGVIGRDSELPWNIPEDMAYFRATTLNQIIVMGRKSFDAIGRPLPKRENCVITRDPNWKKEGVRVFHQVQDAIHFYRNPPAELKDAFSGKDLYIIGGAEIFRLAFSLLDELLLTEIEEEVPGNIVLPDYQNGKLMLPQFRLASQTPQKDFSSSSFHYSFNRYFRS